MAIQTREELLNALADAAELEHNLACLYLYAAFSIKDGSDGVAGLDLVKLNGWKAKILGVAKEEMGHLGAVCNLLAAVGGAPHLGRPNFPLRAGYYPPAIDFTLERFGLGSLSRFVEFERNANAPGAIPLGIGPKDVPFDHVGELYAALKAFFELPSAEGIFIGRDQDYSAWEIANVRGIVDPSVHPDHLTKSQQAVKLIDAIIVEGEGTSALAPPSHYHTFLGLHQELKAHMAAQPGFSPVRPVIANPVTRLHRDNGGQGNVITDPFTLDVAELCNSVYGTMVLMLMQYYAFAGESTNQTEILRDNAKSLMTQIRRLGELLTKLEMGPPNQGFTAGASFEFYRSMHVSPRPVIAWPVMRERLQIAAGEAQRLAALPGIPAVAAVKLPQVAANLQGIVDNLNSDFPIG